MATDPARITTPERTAAVAAAIAALGDEATLDALVRLALRKAAK